MFDENTVAAVAKAAGVSAAKVTSVLEAWTDHNAGVGSIVVDIATGAVAVRVDDGCDKVWAVTALDGTTSVESSLSGWSVVHRAG